MNPAKSTAIYVLERNPIHNSLIKYHLNVNRFLNVQTFTSGNECLYRLQKGPQPDFLITEYETGDHNGFDFMRKVKLHAPGSRIIFFSSYDDPILAVRLLDAGATDYISKTGKLDIGIKELIKNLEFLIREELQARKVGLDLP
jgi:two-component system, NtrC family, response regulator AtoC